MGLGPYSHTVPRISSKELRCLFPSGPRPFWVGDDGDSAVWALPSLQTISPDGPHALNANRLAGNMDPDDLAHLVHFLSVDCNNTTGYGCLSIVDLVPGFWYITFYGLGLYYSTYVRVVPSN